MAAVNDAWAALGKRIKEERERRGWTQRELADAIELSDRFISNLERGQRMPSPKTILAVAGALEIKPSQLFAGVPPAYSTLAADAAQLASLLKDATPEDRATVIDFVRSFVRRGARRGKKSK